MRYGASWMTQRSQARGSRRITDTARGMNLARETILAAGRYIYLLGRPASDIGSIAYAWAELEVTAARLHAHLNRVPMREAFAHGVLPSARNGSFN